MGDAKWPLHTLPADAALAALVQLAAGLIAEAAPLAGALLGGVPELPDVTPERVASAVSAMALLADRLEALPPIAAPDDEIDRQALGFALRRSVAAFRPPDPAGPEALEQHLQLRLLRLLQEPDGALESLVELVEYGPEFLRSSRPAAAGGGRPAGELAVEAAGRLPLLLDACAAAGRELAPTPLRLRLEAALGALLQAGAEESGWLLREYRPQAVDPPAAEPDTMAQGLGMTISELESAAEAALTDAVLAPAPAAEEVRPLEGVEEVRLAWEAQLHGPPAAASDPGLEVMRTPPWLESLLPGLSLVLPGPLSVGPPRLLVAGRQAGTADDVALIHQSEFLPWVHQRARLRLARALVPAPDLLEGWRAHVRQAGAGGTPPWPRELAWRASLALASIAMSVRGATAEQAAGMVASESGVPEATARLQCLHLRRRPLAGLTFLAGRSAVAAALVRVGPGPLLAAGPLPAAAATLLV